MLSRSQDEEQIIERVAACDIGKAELVCCIRVPDAGHPGRRLQEAGTYPTMTRSLLVLADRLAGLGVTRVVMEATSDYWKPVLPAGGGRVRDLAVLLLGVATAVLVAADLADGLSGPVGRALSAPRR